MGSFNLLTEKWIPIIRNDSTADKVGILEALKEAEQVCGVHAPLPLDTVAIYRFLLAVLQWCKSNPSPEEIAAVVSAKLLPEAWFTQLIARQNEFELFGEKSGFYQEYAAWKEYNASKEKRKRAGQEIDDKFNAAANLLPELPSGTNVAHFRRTRDRRDGLCPACCALGLVRLSAFATHSAHPPYYGGKPSGINGPTPVYALPLGRTLLESLLLNWPMPTKSGDRPGWVSNECPAKDDIGCIAAFTWRPRRIWLARPDEEQAYEVCEYCGQRSHAVIREIAFLPGWERPFAKESWPDDPHLLIHLQEGKARGSKPKSQPLGFPNVSLTSEFHARQWRKLYAALLNSLSQNLKQYSPPQHRHIREAFAKKPLGEFHAVAFFGAAVVNQALYQDAVFLNWRFPKGNLAPDTMQSALAELEWLNGLKPWGVLAHALPRNARERPEITAALSNDAARAEAVLRGHFEKFFRDLVGAAPDARACWRSEVKLALAGQVRQAQAILAVGSLFSRKFSEFRAQAAVGRAFEQLQGVATHTHSQQQDKEGDDDAD